MLARIARTTVSRRLSAASTPALSRGYADKFQEKENAQEGQYAKEQERLQLAKLRKQIEEAKASLAKLEKEHADAEKK